MKAKHVAIYVILFLNGCAQVVKPNIDRPWKPFGFVGLLEKIEYVAGDDAINCGYHDLLTEKGRVSYDIGFDCVMESDEQGKPFKIGTVRIPRDSYAFEVIIRDIKSEYWFITYDSMIGMENEDQLWVRVCKHATFTLNDDEVTDCIKVTGVDWEKSR